MRTCFCTCHNRRHNHVARRTTASGNATASRGRSGGAEDRPGLQDAGPFKPEWSSLETYEIPQWYKDAKFGIFIHWGAYSVPAFGSEWYPRQMYINRDRRGDNFFEHHLKTYGPQKTFGYKDFIPDFKAENFDAAEWAKLFKQTGAKYVIPVAEHHDGFPMYDCSYTRWNASQDGAEAGRDRVNSPRRSATKE